MKNVAATNGQSVSFAALFFGVESTREGTWAGTDMLLNFNDRPPWATFARDAAGRANSLSKNTRSARARNKKNGLCDRFLARSFTHHNLRESLDGPQLTPAQKQTDINRQLNTTLRTEVEKLCEMANELRAEMMHSNPSETLSVAFVKKAQAIEKLAKQIKDHARG